MKLMQCRDDWAATEVRLESLLRRHGGRATSRLFVDSLHPSEAGYRVWRDRLSQALASARTLAR